MTVASDSGVMSSRAPPILDFSAFYKSDTASRQKLVSDVRDCCLHNGFFQIVGHPVPLELQRRVMACNKKFMELPLEDKKKVGKELNSWNRGYELLRSQILEEGTLPELKEGYYIGEDIPKSHPYFINKKLNSGPNLWPEFMDGVEEFKRTSMEYYHAMTKLAKDILVVLALTLDLPETYFDEFALGAVATMRFLHYPPQPSDSESKLMRGIGAHTDFGAITLLMQGDIDGLQVFDKELNDWLDVTPVEGAFVVNLGNLFMRWSNDRYISNLHRVINKSGKERYSIPVFFSGNPDYTIECLPTCKSDDTESKYPPITVEAAVGGSYKDSYGRAERYKRELEEQAAAATKTKTMDVSTRTTISVA